MRYYLLLSASLILWPAANATAQRVDQLGDPLPDGVIARLGTARLRETDTVLALAFSPDGKVLASSAVNSSAVHLWDTASGKEIRKLPTEYVSTLAFSPDGKLLAAGDGLGAVHIHDLAGKENPRRFRLPARAVKRAREKGEERGAREDQERVGEVRFVRFTEDGKLLLAGSDQNAVCAWEVATSKEVRRGEGGKAGVEVIAYSADARQAAVRDGMGQIGIATAGAEGKSHPLAGRQSAYTPASFSPDGKTIVAEGEESVLYLSNVATGKVIRQLRGSPVGLRSLVFSADGKVLAGGGSGVVVLWDVESGKELRRLEGLHAGSAALACSPDGKMVAVGGVDGTIRLRRLSGEDACPLPGHQAGVNRIAYFADGKSLVSAGEDGTVRFWDAASGKELRHVKPPSGAVGVLAFSADCKHLVSWGNDGFVHLWDGNTGKEVRKIDGPARPASPGTALSADGSRLAVWDHDPVLRLFETTGGREIRRFSAPKEMVTAAFSPDGETLATTDRGHTLRLWRTSSGREFRECQGHTSDIWSVVFSPDGRTVLSRGNDTTLRLWEVATGKERWRQRINADAAVLSPDGKQIVTAIGSLFFLWDAATGKKIREWQGHRRWVRGLAYSPDGRTLASGSADTSILIWDMNAKRQPEAAAVELTPGDTERFWEDLASTDAGRANQAINAVAGAPGQSVPLFRKHLRPVPAPEGVAKLIADLGNVRFAVRSKALAELTRLGETAEPELRRALTAAPPLEVRRRLENLLDEIDGRVPPADLLRGLRAVEVLERIGGAEARKLIESLAGGAAEARLTREAKAALRRVSGRTE